MHNDLDNYYLQHNEPVKSCLFALRTLILNYDANITEVWKYRMPFFCYKGKMFCYIWVHKKLHLPYIGIVEGKRIKHSALILEKRARMKIMLIDAEKDIPIKTIETIFKMAMQLYK